MVIILNFESIFSKEYTKVDTFVQRTCRVLAYIYMLIWLLNLVGIFIVDQTKLTILAIPCVLFLFVPTFLFKYIKNRELTRYIVFAIITLEMGVIFSVFTFHTILMFLYPALLVTPYGDIKLKRFTICATGLSMVFSHIASYYFCALPDEPFKSMYGILVYGLTPRLIEYFVFVFILNFITKRNKVMLNTVFKYSIDMYNTQEEVVRQFAELSESKSRQTGSHVKRVSLYVNVMATELGINEQEKESLVMASMLHDVGKLLIPSEIIEKPGKLTPEEYEIIKTHTDIGYKLLEKSPGRVMEIAKVIAYQHHERWDGKGYHGLKGEEIDYYSRIMAITDVFDALISKRSYKDSWGYDDAYIEIVNQAGKQFDPQLIETFKVCFIKFVAIANKLPD